jgi:hypothetical protein
MKSFSVAASSLWQKRFKVGMGFEEGQEGDRLHWEVLYAIGPRKSLANNNAFIVDLRVVLPLFCPRSVVNRDEVGIDWRRKTPVCRRYGSSIAMPLWLA